MKPLRTRRNTLVVLFAGIASVILLVLFAVIVLGGVYFANTASGQSPRSAITKVTGMEFMPPAKQTVMARTFPTDNPNTFVAPPGAPTPILPTLAPPPTGFPPDVPHHAAGAGEIVEDNRSAPLNHGYDVVNEWWATTNNEKIRAFAGCIRDDAQPTDCSQGFVSVTHQSLDYSRFTRPQVTVETPSKTGALTIVDATGMTLNLQSDQGVTYYFDVNTGIFVSQ